MHWPKIPPKKSKESFSSKGKGVGWGELQGLISLNRGGIIVLSLSSRGLPWISFARGWMKARSEYRNKCADG